MSAAKKMEQLVSKYPAADEVEFIKSKPLSAEERDNHLLALIKEPWISYDEVTQTLSDSSDNIILKQPLSGTASFSKLVSRVLHSQRAHNCDEYQQLALYIEKTFGKIPVQQFISAAKKRSALGTSFTAFNNGFSFDISIRYSLQEGRFFIAFSSDEGMDEAPVCFWKINAAQEFIPFREDSINIYNIVISERSSERSAHIAFLDAATLGSVKMLLQESVKIGHEQLHINTFIAGAMLLSSSSDEAAKNQLLKNSRKSLFNSLTQGNDKKNVSDSSYRRTVEALSDELNSGSYVRAVKSAAHKKKVAAKAVVDAELAAVQFKKQKEERKAKKKADKAALKARLYAAHDARVASKAASKAAV